MRKQERAAILAEIAGSEAARALGRLGRGVPKTLSPDERAKRAAKFMEALNSLLASAGG